MTSFLAKPSISRASARRVLFVIYPGISLLDLAGPLQAMSWAREEATGELGYEVSIVSKSGGSVQTDTIVSVDSDPMDNWIGADIDTLMIIGGDGVYTAVRESGFVKTVAKLTARSRRVCSVCSGAIVLAATGILDGKRAVTHWEDTGALSQMYQSVKVETDPIYIKEGNIWTSAGVTSGIDMALALIAEDLGSDAALARAQALVAYMVRPGGQSQFSPVLESQQFGKKNRFQKLHSWIKENLARDLKAHDLAEFEGMSVRSFYRLYTETTGNTPAKAIEAIRVEAARELLENTSSKIKSLSSKCGFGDEERMRRAFIRAVGISPQEYRQRFQIPGTAVA